MSIADMSFPMNKIVQFVGWAILFFSLVYVGHNFLSNIDVVLHLGLDSDIIIVILVGSICYAALLIPTSIGWGMLLFQTSNASVSWPQIISVYGRASIAKYLPGNIFHYVGRQLLGHDMGLRQRDIAIASFMEVVLVVFVCCCLISALGPLVDRETMGEISIVFVSLVAACIVFILCFVFWNVKRIPLLGKFVDLRSIGKVTRSPYLFVFGGLYLIVFGVSMVLLWAIHGIHVDEWAWDNFPVIGFAFVLSWLAGYLTPGAPGGIGIREAGLVFLLNPIGEAGIAVTMALAYRVVTLLGEALQCVLAIWVHRTIVNRRVRPECPAPRPPPRITPYLDNRSIISNA